MNPETIDQTSGEKLLLCLWPSPLSQSLPGQLVVIGMSGDKIQNDVSVNVGANAQSFLTCHLPRDPGCYVWEGDLVYTRSGGNYRTSWTGEIRPARLADFEEMGIKLPKE